MYFGKCRRGRVFLRVCLSPGSSFSLSRSWFIDGSLFRSVCLCLCLCQCLSVTISVFACLCYCLCITVSASVCFCNCLCLSLPLSLHLCLSVYLSVINYDVYRDCYGSPNWKKRLIIRELTQTHTHPSTHIHARVRVCIYPYTVKQTHRQRENNRHKPMIHNNKKEKKGKCKTIDINPVHTPPPP